MDFLYTSTNWFLLAGTLIAGLSLAVNKALTRSSMTADRAFWLAWLILIWSGELVTNTTYSEYHSSYVIDPETRKLVLVTFCAAFAGFLIGSLFFKGGIANVFLPLESSLSGFVEKAGAPISSVIFLVGFFEFRTNYSKFGDLADLRLASVTGEVETNVFFTQFFYFAMAFLITLACADALSGKISLRSSAIAILGLVLHNLAIGGRINLIVAPALYTITFLFQADQRGMLKGKLLRDTKLFVAVISIAVPILFLFIKILKSRDSSATSDVGSLDLLIRAFLSIPMYISETLIALHIHSIHAKESWLPTGYFTFDFFYRGFQSVLDLQLQDPNTVFGHAYYRDTRHPWAWTQANMIPRLLADFGDWFWVWLILISATVQALTLFRLRVPLLGVGIRSLMFLASLETILLTGWFSAFNVYILLYLFLIYRVLRIRVQDKVNERSQKRR